MSYPLTITTLHSPDGRVKLITPSAEEDEAAAILRSDPIARRFLRFLPESISSSEIAERRETRAKDARILDLSVFVRDDDGQFQFGGVTGVFHMDEVQMSCEAGILISSRLHGSGLATTILYTLFQHIFEGKNFHRISMETGVDNLPMRGWLEKVADMRLEGQKKEWWKEPGGGWTDVMSYAVLDWEWKERVKPNLEREMGLKAGNKLQVT